MVELDVPDNEEKKGEILKANPTLNFASIFASPSCALLTDRQRSALCRLSAASNPALVIRCLPQETPQQQRFDQKRFTN